MPPATTPRSPQSPVNPPAAPYGLDSLVTIMAQLRDPVHGCPWDREQSFATIAPYTIEEAYEVADAIAHDDMAALKDELGDLLLQVIYHARLAEEAGAFDVMTVIAGICEKMIRRHPHVYAPQEQHGVDADEIKGAWEDRKAAERTTAGALDGVALGLPALLRAEKLQRRAARVGFDWPDRSGPLAKIDEELAEYAAADSDASRTQEFGDILFSLVNLARHDGIDAEAALRAANAKFEHRFAAMEQCNGGSLAGQDIDALEALWQRAKAAETR